MNAEAEADKDERYYRESCGGSEFFSRYGAAVLKPALQLAMKRADLEAGMTALDAGCGRGELLYQLRQRGVKALGGDFAPAALPLAQKTSKAAVARLDARKLPFKSAAFDRIFFLGVVDHLRDPDLELCFDEFRRLLKPGGFVLLSTCANTDYHKRLTYALRRRLAETMGMKAPSPPRSTEDEELHVNEHNEAGLRSFLERRGWKADIEARPNDKFAVSELYGDPLPDGFPLRKPSAPRRFLHALAFRGPWKRFMARELFCRARPRMR